MGCKVNCQIEVSPTTPTQSFEAHIAAVGIVGGTSADVVGWASPVPSAGSEGAGIIGGGEAGAGVVGWVLPVPGAGSEGAGIAGGDGASKGTSEGMSEGIEFPKWSGSDGGGTARKFDISPSTASSVKGACWPMCQEQNELRMDK